MDIYSAGFLIVVVLLGGIIAFFADRLGRTLGKKRLSLFGLRPRHTAEFLTVTAGILIPLLTVVLMLTFSSDLRQTLFEGRRALAEVETLRKTRDDLRKEVEKSSGDLERTRSELASTNRSLAEARSSAVRLTAEAAKLTDQTRTMSARVASLSRQYGSLRAEYASLQKSKKSLDETYQTLTATRNEAERRNLELDRENARLESQTKLLEGTIAQLTQQAQDLQKEVDDTRTRFQKERGELVAESSRLGADLERVKRDLQEAESDLLAAERELGQLRAISEALTASSRKQPMTFAMGDEVARLTVDADLTVEAAREALVRLLRSARVEAELQGARGARNIPVAGLTDIVVDGRVVTAAQQEMSIISQISRVGQPLVLVASSGLNAFVGEPVSVQVRWYPNRLVFTRGELIAETRIEGNRSEGEIFRQISAFLSTQVRDRARQTGMVPIVGRPDSLGSVDEDTILKLVFAIRQDGGRVRLQALASQDTYSADPLRLELRIR